MQPSVLIVDDLPFMRAAAARMVAEAGMIVSGEAEDGRQALASYLAHRPDVVLLDIAMPVMDGLTALRKLTILDPACRVVMCCTPEEHRLVIKAIGLGARDFLVKPLDAGRLAGVIAKVLARDGLS